jgi:hypothetical protein
MMAWGTLRCGVDAVAKVGSLAARVESTAVTMAGSTAQFISWNPRLRRVNARRVRTAAGARWHRDTTAQWRGVCTTII